VKPRYWKVLIHSSFSLYIVREGSYADDISLLAETVEELNMMLQVCQAWTDQNGFVFSVEKSKAMVLAGTDPLGWL